MARWLLLHLENGLFEGRQIVSKARIMEMHTPQYHAEPDTQPGTPRAPITNYGLGWFVNTHAGRTVVEHSGTQTGFVSWMAMMPNERLGLVILSNLHRTGINYALRFWIFDRLLNRPEKDWSHSVQVDFSQGWQRLVREAKEQFAARQLPETSLARPVADYAGTYESKVYGTIEIAEDNGRLRLQYGPRFRGELTSWGKDRFRVFFPNPRLDDWLLTFQITDGKVASLRAQESPWAPDWYEDRDDLGVFDHR